MSILEPVEKMMSGTKGRLIRSILSTVVGVAVAKYQSNVWFMSLTPFLQTLSKHVRDRYPNTFEWLPF